MNCPKCGFLNPESAQRCNCGYDFISRSMQGSYSSRKDREESPRGWKRSYWPAIYDLESAKHAARQGAVAAFFCAAAAALFGILGQASRDLGGVNAWSLLEAVLIAGLGLGVWKLSRVCAVCSLALYLLERVASFLLLGVKGVRGVAMLVIIPLCFVNGIRGAMAYHRFKPRNTEIPDDASLNGTRID
jgi:hypothetical protein